jgi:hypothetical protein
MRRSFSSGIVLGTVIGFLLYSVWSYCQLHPDVKVVIANSSGYSVTDLKVEFTESLCSAKSLDNNREVSFMAVVGHATGIKISYRDTKNLQHDTDIYFETGYGSDTLRYSIGPDFEIKRIDRGIFERIGLTAFFK